MTDFVIIYGSLRSGTTMLRLMLDAHSRLTCPGETDFLVDHIDVDADRYDREALEASRIYRASRASIPSDREGKAATEAMVAQLRGDAEGPLLLMQHRALRTMLRLFPDAKVVHMLRDPRDVARSAIGMGWAGNVYYGAETWLKTERGWDEAAPLLKPGQVHEVKYEDLVRAPERELAAICEFVGEAFEPAMLSYASSTTYEAPDVSLIEQWRRKQSPRELGLLEPLIGEMAAARGYAPSGADPIAPGPLARLGLWLDNKTSIWRMRVRRYGLLDPLVFAAAGRLGLRGPMRAAQRRIDEKAIAQLK